MKTASTSQVKYISDLVAGFKMPSWENEAAFVNRVICSLTGGNGINQGRIILVNQRANNAPGFYDMIEYAKSELAKIDYSQVSSEAASLMIDGAKKSPAAALVEYLEIKHDAEKIVEFLSKFFNGFVIDIVEPGGPITRNMYHDKRGEPVTFITQK